MIKSLQQNQNYPYLVLFSICHLLYTQKQMKERKKKIDFLTIKTVLDLSNLFPYLTQRCQIWHPQLSQNVLGTDLKNVSDVPHLGPI